MAASDKALLDRLNALKPSGISLSGGSQIPLASAGGAGADTAAHLAPGTATTVPVSREDALAARLRTLRRGQDDAQRPSPRADGPIAEGGEEEAKTTSPFPAAAGGAIGPLATADEQALDDLLLALAASDLADEDAAADEEDDGLLPLPDVPTGLEDSSSGDEDGDADKADEEKVAALLRDLGGPDARRAGVAAGADAVADDSDDSDGEAMRRDVKDVLAQAEAEAEWAHQGQEEDQEATGPPETEAAPDDRAATAPAAEGSTVTDHVLHLPAVPTKLVDPLPPVKEAADGDDDPDSSISARLAALRGLHGKSAGLGHTDAFGLPSAPTFQPGEAGAGGWRRAAGVRYTDADQQTWCIVCLEDASVRCLGCSDSGAGGAARNDAYCARCWRAMHVGPAAGFDERGHQRVPLVRRQGP